MPRTLEIYIFHSLDSVVISSFLEDQIVGYELVPKQELGEKFVETFISFLFKFGYSLEDIESLYLQGSFSTWNASRLITLFSKTLTFFSEIKLFLLQESLDKADVNLALKNFCNSKNDFRLINEPDKIDPIYKKCPNINI